MRARRDALRRIQTLPKKSEHKTYLTGCVVRCFLRSPLAMNCITQHMGVSPSADTTPITCNYILIMLKYIALAFISSTPSILTTRPVVLKQVVQW